MDTKSRIESLVKSFLREDSSNRIGGPFGDERIWGEPLIGYASGKDSLFVQYRDVVDPHHWTPSEIFAEAFPEAPKAPRDLTVISWILPQTEKTKKDNGLEKCYPSHRWARARIMGEEANEKLRLHLEQKFSERGIRSVAPAIFRNWKRLESVRFVYSSIWSERHIAHACGLGTFGLCDGLITSSGKAMRAGSVVVDLQLEPTPRPYSRHDEYCTFLAKGTCGACISRCPVGAISKAGHDKVKCGDFQREITTGYVREKFGFDGYGCGLCQTGVPCENSIPT